MAQTLNGITCAGSRMLSKDSVEFSLMDTTVDEAADLNKADTLEVKDGDALVASYAGFKVVEVALATDGESVRLTASRELPAETKEAIRAIESNLQVVSTTAEAATTAAAEAKEIAESAGTDPQVATVAKLTARSIDFTSVSATDTVAIPDYIPEWEDCIGKTLPQNSPVKYNGTIYRTSQQVQVQEHYDPVTAGESQYYPIEVAPDGIIVYRTCHGSYDMVLKGEKRHYPDANGPVYIALQNADRSPEEWPQYWQLVEDAA